MTEEELHDHEAHARAVDSRMSERVLALVDEVRRMKQREGFLEAVSDAWESLLNTAREQMTEAYDRARELKRERDEALRGDSASEG